MEIKKVGRPHKEINITEFEKLCGLQCTKEEICGFFETTDKTLDAWIKRTYGEEYSFSEIFRIKRSNGKIALRRTQFRLAEKDSRMAIWLGKQYLEQKDNVEVAAGLTVEDDALTKSLEAFAKGLKSDEI